MNANLFRLVFNKKLGMYVPAHEAVRSHSKGGRASVSAAAATALMLVATLADARPAVTTPAANALPTAAANFVSSGNGSVSTVGAAMTVIQTTPTLGLNWTNFNIGSAASVTFNQPNAASRVLNRIGSTDPSVIMGRLNANGQVYLINPNGILFGNGAQVNVGGLVASALNGVTDDLLNKGMPSAVGDKLGFAWEGNALGFANGFVAVDPGASITTASGSRVVLLAPKTVENLGHIETGAGGEAILAAGGSVMLTAPADPNLRGLLVEVKSWKGVDGLGNSVTLDGKATNKADGSVNADGKANGEITAPSGVITLAALAVNQEGTVKAGKAINLNGQIMLVAGTTQADKLTVTQTGDKAEIDWKSGFNINSAADAAVNFKSVEFVQPTTGAVAYNFVNDPDRIAADGSALDQAGRSSIDGVLKANGQLFIINEKGIDFGSHADVKASNFVASALGISSDIVAIGILSQVDVTKPAFALSWTDWSLADSDTALDLFRQATIEVANTAKFVTADNGYAILAGAKVNQAGSITTPGGQTILAAGAKLYLKPAYSSNQRGFTAEVDPLYVLDGTTRTPLSRGVDANKVSNSGTISASFGNITLVGHQIEQRGKLLSSTSVTRNGSIRLVARDLVVGYTDRLVEDGKVGAVDLPRAANGKEDGVETFVFGTLGGELTFATGSTTEIALDGGDKQTIEKQQSFTPSFIEATAARINIEGSASGLAGARLTAHGGDIQLSAAAKYDNTNALSVNSVLPVSTEVLPVDIGIFVGSGAKLDVSGVTANKSAADLFMEVELRGDQFANNPVQRDGALSKKTAWVDIRDSVAIADLAGYFDKVAQILDERAATGGDIVLRSTGSVIVKQDAVLDVSGGRVDYAAGVVKESKALTKTGNSYRLNDAPSDLAYAGLRTSERREAAYTEGKSAGSVELTGQRIALDGTLLGKTVRGARQRNLDDPATDRYSVPKGAKLIVRDAGQHFQPVGTGEADKAAAYSLAQIAFVAGKATSANGLNFGDSAGPKLEISQSLVDAGFSRFDIRSDGRIDIPDGVTLNLASGGEFKASGRQVYVGGDISAPGGSISLATRDFSLVAGFPTEATYSTLTVDATALLSTAGRWLNDRLDIDPANQSAKAINGGSITLDSAYDLVLESGSLLDVSGGARLKSDAKLEAGNAGSIKLSTGRFGLVSLTDAQDSGLFLDGTLAAYAIGKGGKLEINTSQIRFGQPLEISAAFTPEMTREDRLELANPDDKTDLRVGALDLSAGFLNLGGFNTFKFTGRDGLTVDDNVTLAPKPLSWSLDGVYGYSLRKTGARLADFAKPLSLHSEMRAVPTAITLATRSVAFGDLNIGEGAKVRVDPQGSIELESWRQLSVLGTLEARGGSIRLTRPAPIVSNPTTTEGMEYSPAQQSLSIFLGQNSKLLAGGVTKLDAATRAALEGGESVAALRAQGRYRGTVLAGGGVELNAGLGYLITRPGGLIDVSGTSDTISQLSPGGLGNVYQIRLVGSSGGRVSLSARDGLFLDGTYSAGGGAGATDGVFSLRFSDSSSRAASTDAWNVGERHDLADRDALLAPRQLTLYQSTDGHEDLWPADISESNYLAGLADIDAATHNGQARLDLATLDAGSFGSWYLQSQGEMAFEGAITGSVNNQLRLDSPIFNASSDAAYVNLTAAAAQIGNFGGQLFNNNVPQADPAIGRAIFEVTARDIGLNGNFAWNGFGDTTFISRGELHLDSMAYDGKPLTGVTGNLFNGGLRGTGNLDMSAARVSPATYSNFIVDLTADPAAILTISQPEVMDALGPQLAVAGKLEFKAASIEHHGLISAPLGQVAFSAPGGKVTLGAKSVTSVAADSLMPLGQSSQSGRDWEFLASNLDPNGALSSTLLAVAVPEKDVRIDAAVSQVESGAMINLSGGGDAVAWEFSPGPGGKADVLAWNFAKEPTTFVILPGWSGNFAPADSQRQTGYNVSNPKANKSEDGTITYSYDALPSLKSGDQIELASNPSGMSGRFTLLPASYALLKGAILVTVKPTQNSVTGSSKTQADGSFLVAGTRLAADVSGGYTPYSQDALTLELAPLAVVQKRARYIETTASGYFYDQPGVQLPGDAGRLSVAGRTTLGFDPVVLGQRAAQIASGDGRSRAGRGIVLDLAAPKIEVVDGGTLASGTGWTTFDKTKLNDLGKSMPDDLGISSLLLGGLRSVDGSTSSIETISADVRIATSASDPVKDKDALQAPEILLTATDEVSIEAGSVMAANGDAPAQDFVLTGDGAFARIAGGAQAGLERKGGVTRTQGDLNLATGATVKGRALIFDATHANTLAGTVKLHNLGSQAATGGALAIGANRINVVGNGSTPLDGLTLSNAAIAGFGSPDQLRLTSYSTLDFYGPATLGTASLKELVIAAAGVAGHGTAGTTAKILGENVRFENPNPDSAAFAAGAALGAGALEVEAQTVSFGDNATEVMRDAEQSGFALRGFADVTVTASEEVRFEGRGVTRVDNNDGDGATIDALATLTLDAGRVVAASVADHVLVASGAGEIKGGENAATTTGLGGRLDLRADSLDIGGRVLAPAGSLAFTATGAGKNVTVKTGAVVAAEGAAVAFADTQAYAPGGKIALKSELGDVSVEGDAAVSVSAHPDGGDAGKLALIAQNGTVSAAANTLHGSASGDYNQGELGVDAINVDVDELAQAVGTKTRADGTTMAEFSGLWDIRRREGDIVLSKIVKAKQVRFAADAGDIGISGVIDASGAKGGMIELYANRATGSDGNVRGGHVSLGADSLLKANAAEAVGSGQGTAGSGGTVIVGVSATKAVDELFTGIEFDAAASIDVSSAQDSLAPLGKVIFLAPRQDTEGAAIALKTLQNTALDWANLTVLDAAGVTTTTFTLASTMSSYQKGMVVAFKAPQTNTAALTLNVNLKGAKSVFRADGTALDANDIVKDSIVVAVYDGTAFRINSIGAADVGSANIYKVTPAIQPDAATALRDGYVVTFRAKTASTNDTDGTATLQIVSSDASAAVKPSLKREGGGNLQANDIKANQLVTAIYTITDAATGAGEFRLAKNTALATLPATVTASEMALVSLAGTVKGVSSVALEGVRTTRVEGDYLLNAVNQNKLLSATSQAAALKGADFLAAADKTGGKLGLVYRPGEEVRATGNITVGDNWDLGRTRYAGQPGVLSLRADKNLYIDASISDGFKVNKYSSTFTFSSVDRNADIASSGASWSYRLVAGADSAAGNPLAVKAAAATDASGNILLAKDRLIRTGTGDIALAARRDITLSSGAAVYTAGIDDTLDPVGFKDAPLVGGGATEYSKLKLFFPTGGGSLSATAGRNIETGSSGQISDWLVRWADAGKNPQWMPRIPSFREGFAVFGGGDLDLSAGGSLTNVTAVIPTNGRVPLVDGVLRADLAQINGGGDLRVRAGDAINGGVFYAETGILQLRVENSITAGAKIAFGNSAVRVVTGSDMDISSIQNPLFAKPAYKDSRGSPITSGPLQNTGSGLKYTAQIGTYGADSLIDLLSVAGNLNLASTEGTDYAPSQARITALLGDVEAAIYQMPGEDGQLDILAGGGIAMRGVTQYDIAQFRLPSIANPLLNGASNVFADTAPVIKHTADFWHLNDNEPSRLIAKSGDISAPTGVLPPTLEFNEAILVEAAGSIRNVGFVSQHTDDADVTRIVAGESVILPTTKGPTSGDPKITYFSGGEETIQVNGPGRLEVIAGAGVDLGNSTGIVTRGNLENPYLPEGGASVFVLAGATPDYAGLRVFLNMGGEVGEVALRDGFYQYLRDQGRDALAGGGEPSYEAGREAIRAFFPAGLISGGDIEFFSSQIKTEQGGGIDLLAPGGGVTVGIANPDKYLKKESGVLGLFTIRGGDIRAMVRDDFLVNQSRVFTLDGGDILIWADQGSIDAGSGAKTVSATPPPVLVIRNGQIVLDTSGSVSGSGIGALASRADTPASDLDLFAPQGAIDAGDAGLRSTGNVFLGATTILNSANIQVGGVATGVPIATGGITGLSGVSSPSEATASTGDVTKSMGEGAAKDGQAAQEMKQALASFKPSFISVEVLGFGDGTASVSDELDEDEKKRREEAQRRRG